MIKKTISILMVLILLSSQIGCGNKVLTTPLSQAQFDSNYTYNIHAVQNTELPNVPGSNIQNLPDRIHITQNNQTKYLLHSQIQSIDGESYQNFGTKALEGMAIGGGAGAILGGITFYAISVNSECEDDCEFMDLMSLVLGIPIGATVGGLTGLAIGSTIPKKQKIQITGTGINVKF